MTIDVHFTEELKQSNVGVWNKILKHRFLIEISEDILPMKKFVFYLNQDSFFLCVVSNLLTEASKIVSNKEEESLIKSLIRGIRDETQMQKEILDILGDDPKGLSEISTHMITRDYTSYLMKVYHSKDISLIVSALAPCVWTYYEISDSLVSNNIQSEIIKKWLRFYSSKESLKQIDQLKKFLDSVTINADKKIRMKYYFSISCDYELEFWDMAYYNKQ